MLHPQAWDHNWVSGIVQLSYGEKKKNRWKKAYTTSSGHLHTTSKWIQRSYYELTPPQEKKKEKEWVNIQAKPQMK